MQPDFPALASELLCTARFEVEGGVLPIGATPFGNKRVGYITGGVFEGPRLSGVILPGGGNWSTTGEVAPGEAAGTFDARSVWKTDDGAVIHVAYGGRSVVSTAVSARFVKDEDVDPADYYLRIAPTFETADPRYLWLNGVLAVGCGVRLPGGVRHSIFAIK